jgi:RNA polymerase sigma-70 factor (ECF subfamily)
MDDADSRGSDDAVVDRLARAGDTRAFETFYSRHADAVNAAALRLTRDADVAQDLAHDAWVRAVESLGRFERRSSFRTWLIGILVNRVREHERAGRHETPGATAADDDAMEDVVDPSTTPPLDGDGIDPIDLDAAISALAPRFRQVFVLHDIEGFTHEEIAAALGVVPGTSKSQLARARHRVRELLSAGTARKST